MRLEGDWKRKKEESAKRKERLDDLSRAGEDDEPVDKPGAGHPVCVELVGRDSSKQNLLRLRHET
jgi:hypothetical protein